MLRYWLHFFSSVGNTELNIFTVQTIESLFNSVKLLCNFIEITHGCSPVNLLHIFRTRFPKNTSDELLLKISGFLIFEGGGGVHWDMKWVKELSIPVKRHLQINKLFLIFHFCVLSVSKIYMICYESFKFVVMNFKAAVKLFCWNLILQVIKIFSCQIFKEERDY